MVKLNNPYIPYNDYVCAYVLSSTLGIRPAYVLKFNISLYKSLFNRPSPKLVLIALQLCRIALPLMTVAECSQVVVPPHPSLPPRPKGEPTGSSLAADIVKLLLAKLAEYIVPDASQVSQRVKKKFF